MSQSIKEQDRLSEILETVAKARLGFHNGLSLNTTLSYPSKYLSPNSVPVAKKIIFETMRRNALISQYIEENSKTPPELNVRIFIEAGLGCMFLNQFEDFTIVNEVVNSVKTSELSNPHASGYVNAILRNFLRNKEQILKDYAIIDSVRFNAPHWWINKLKDVAPNDWERILKLQAKQPPMTLRVNTQKVSVENFMKGLAKVGLETERVGQDAVILTKPVNIQDIPGFAQGYCSVQDAGTQLATHLLPIKQGDRVLDACAAPGGKTCHMLEKVDCDMTALELDEHRAQLIAQNLKRIGLNAKLKVTNALDLWNWWDQKEFDAILLDAPCSASGVVRRQIDTPWLRKPQDIKNLATTQKQLLECLWGILKKGGYLLYSTCSIFPEEGKDQIDAFLKKHPDAKLCPIANQEPGYLTLFPKEEHNWQSTDLIPSVHDGFFYALLKKE